MCGAANLPSGRPKGPQTVRIDGQLPVDLANRIEAWRRAQPAPPSKIKALEYLLFRGLAAATEEKPNGPD
jgi:hypothetical protein